MEDRANKTDRERVEAARKQRLTEDRFWRTVRIGDECWEWVGHYFSNGYARFRWDGKDTNATRYAYELMVGPIPAGANLCHRCDNPRCVRLDHLFIGDDADNMLDCRRKGRRQLLVSDDTAKRIRQARADHGYSHSKLATLYGTSTTTVHSILKGERAKMEQRLKQEADKRFSEEQGLCGMCDEDLHPGEKVVGNFCNGMQERENSR